MAETGADGGAGNGNRRESVSVGMATAGSFDQARGLPAGASLGTWLKLEILVGLESETPGELHDSAVSSDGCCDVAALVAATVAEGGVLALCMTGSGSPG
jgi:hypothetical protein